eukprot:scaffold37643_cov40-Phaeocystis_antarctica.AAC.1
MYEQVGDGRLVASTHPPGRRTVVLCPLVSGRIGGHRRCSTVQRVYVRRVRPRRKPGCTLTSHISWHRRCSTVWPGFFDRVHPGRKLGCALCLCGLVLGRPELQPVRSVNDRHKEWTTVVVTLRAVHS